MDLSSSGFPSERCAYRRALVPRRVLTVAVATTAMATLGGKAEAATLTRSESALLKVMNVVRTQPFSRGASTLRIRRTGIRAPRVGENLAWSSGALSRATVIVNMWLASPEHRANLLHAGYRT